MMASAAYADPHRGTRGDSLGDFIRKVQATEAKLAGGFGPLALPLARLRPIMNIMSDRASSFVNPPAKPVTAPDFLAAKAKGEKLVVLTAYDYTMARLFDAAEVDGLLVGDSLGMVVQGMPNPL